MPALDSNPVTRPSRPPLRFTFRLSTLFIAITVIAVVCAWPRIDRQIHLYQLRPFLNRDLRELDEKERAEFERVMNYIHPPAVSQLFFNQNWYLWDLQTTRGRRLVLFQGQRDLRGNGAAATVFLFSERGDFLCQETIGTGNRIDLLDAFVLTDELPGETLIVAKVEADSWRVAEVRSYYAIIDDRPVLIRLEDNRNRIVTTPHQRSRLLREELPPTSADCLRRLGDKREAKLLQVLIEILAEKELSKADFQLDPAVRKRVAQLTNHRHPWVAEMATATLKKLPAAGE